MLANARRCANIGAIDRDRKRVRWSMKCVESSSYVRLKAQNVRAERENIVRACTLHVENVVLVTHIRYIEGYSDAHLRAPLLYRVKAFVWREEPAHATPDIRPSATTIRERYARAGGCTCISESARVCVREGFWIIGRGCERRRRATGAARRTCYSDRAGSIARKCARARSCAVICVLFVACRFSQKRISERMTSFISAIRAKLHRRGKSTRGSSHVLCIDFAFRSSVGDKSESIAYIYQGCMWYYLEKGGIDL